MKSRQFLLWAAIVVVAAAILLSACKKDENPPVQTPSLYSRLGGTSAITAVIDTFLTFVVADTVIADKFAGALADTTGQRVARLRNMLIAQLCVATGGPCTYTGLSMPQAHQGMNISDSEFDALVGDLVRGLDAYSVGTTEKTELLAILGPLRSQIVGQRPN